MNLKDIRIKQYIDNFLVLNLFIIIAGSLLFTFAVAANINGNHDIYAFFQKLWLPLFLPSISLFFTATLLDALIKTLKKGTN